MAKRKVALALCFLATIGLVERCSLPSSCRYKMTVEVETPEGLRTGSAVREVSYSRRMEGVYNAEVQGEAVAVDLPNGHTLYALLSDSGGDPDYGARVADWALKADLKPGGANTGYKAGKFTELWPTQPKTQSPLWQTHGPMLARFNDEKDASTVQGVDANDLTVHFGLGYKIKRVTIEITRLQVTQSIENRLPWLYTYYDKMLDGHSIHSLGRGFANSLSSGEFRRGFAVDYERFKKLSSSEP